MRQGQTSYNPSLGLERTNHTLAARTDCKGFQVSKHNSVLDHGLSMISSYNMKQKQEASTRVVGAAAWIERWQVLSETDKISFIKKKIKEQL